MDRDAPPPAGHHRAMRWNSRLVPARHEQRFDHNLRQLGQIKATYDPHNLFRINNNTISAS
jgi:quinol monooxygenase YgiN